MLFPTIFKRDKIIPPPRTKTIYPYLNYYRPISSCLFSQGSILGIKKHIHKHLTDMLEARRLFHFFQSGFRRGNSCQTALTRLTSIWLSVFNNRQISGAVFLDLRKAFDLVNYIFFIEKAISLHFKRREYYVLTTLFAWPPAMRACKWHILPRNVYHEWSSSRVDLRPTFVMHLNWLFASLSPSGVFDWCCTNKQTQTEQNSCWRRQDKNTRKKSSLWI